MIDYKARLEESKLGYRREGEGRTQERVKKR